MKFEDTATWKVFEELGRVTFAPGALSTREKELVAVGIAVAMGCEECIRHHIAAAIECGAGREEIGEAICVGAEMGGGPAMGGAAKLAWRVMEEGFRN